MKKIELEQGSQKWLDFRKNKIGASDAPIILEVCPFKKPQQLWEEKVLNKTQHISSAMTFGTKYEPEARDYVNKESNKNFVPCVYQSEKYEWQIASLDGYDASSKEILEIKIPQERTLRKAFNGDLNEYYKIQIQHQFAVCNEAESARLVIYNKLCPDLPQELTVYFKRDKRIEKKLLQKESEFYQKMMDFEPIEQLQYIHTKEFDKAAKNWKEAKERYDTIIEEMEKYKQRLLDLCQDQDSQGAGLTIKKIKRQGSVDYKKMTKDYNIDCEKYRKNPSYYWSIK